MGAVYRAEHTLMKKTVALKLLHGELGQVEEMVRRFEREAQSASRLSHPNIITVTDFGRAESGELYLVMEYVPGRSLADAIDEARYLPVSAGRWASPARSWPPSPTPTPRGWCTAISSRPTSCSPGRPTGAARTWSRSSTSGWPR